MKPEIGTVTGWELRKNKDGSAPVRLLQVVMSDPEDVQTVEWMGKQGEDDGIVLGSTVLINIVGSTKFAFAVDDNIDPEATDGEKILYSIDGGAKSATATLRKNGDIELESKTGAQATFKASGDIDLIAGSSKINLLDAGKIELNGNNDFLISFAQLQTILTNFAAAINIEFAKYTLLPAQTSIPVTINITPTKTADIKIKFP